MNLSYLQGLPSVLSQAIKLLMQKLFSLFFVVGFLIGQIGLVTHVYDEHEADEICEICAVSSHQDQALASAPAEWLVRSNSALALQLNPHGYSALRRSYFSARAPPYSFSPSI